MIHPILQHALRDLSPIASAAMLALMAVVPVLRAHAAEPVIPGAGTMLQQARPVAPPAAPSGDTGLNVERPRAGMPVAGAAVRIERIDIAGNAMIDTATLHALVADAQGRDLTLAQMGELAVRITDYYHAHGYPLARALVPAQTLQSGALRIDVNEARYGSITVDNRSRVSDRLVQATMAQLQADAVITQQQMDRALLLLADIPGLIVNATLKAGQRAGTSDLQILATSTPPLAGGVNVDNHGDRYTGRIRASALANAFDLLHQGDTLGVSALTSGRGMQYGRLSYDALLSGDGLRAGGSWSALRYRLLGALSELDVVGTASVASLWARQPFIRSLRGNLYGQIGYDRLRLSDEIRLVGLRVDRHLDNVAASLSGNMLDGLAGGGETLWTLGMVAGRVAFDDATAQAGDANGARTAGGFTRGNVNLVRLQNLGAQDSLFVNLAGQWASRNLDSSQKVEAGGANTVRAYDTGAVSGDTGYTFTAEWRHTLAPAGYGQWQLTGFIDAAQVEINRSPFSGDARSATLAGTGVGVNWSGPDRTTAKFSVATPVGATPAQIGNRSAVRAWLQASKGF